MYRGESDDRQQRVTAPKKEERNDFHRKRRVRRPLLQTRKNRVPGPFSARGWTAGEGGTSKLRERQWGQNAALFLRIPTEFD